MAIKGITGCTVSRSAEIHSLHGSAGGGAKEAIVGTTDWTATLEQELGRQAGPDIDEGDSGTFTIVETSSNGCTFAAPAVCETSEYTYELDGGAPTGRRYVLRGNGAIETDMTGGVGDTSFSSKLSTFTFA